MKTCKLTHLANYSTKLNVYLPTVLFWVFHSALLNSGVKQKKELKIARFASESGMLNYTLSAVTNELKPVP